MAVKETIYTKKEKFTVFENGQIFRRMLTKEEQEQIQPSTPRIIDKPTRPEPSGFAYISYNIWGEEIGRHYESDNVYEETCQKIDEENEKQTKYFKQHLLEIRKECRRQEIQREKEEKEKKKQFNARRQASAHAYIMHRIMKERTAA